jgi:hypothetical protein
LAREVVLNQQPDGKETIKIAIKNPANLQVSGASRNPASGGKHQEQPNLLPRFKKPKSPEVSRWKTNKFRPKSQGGRPTYDMLLSKYARLGAGFNSNRPYHGKCPRSPLGEGMSQSLRPAKQKMFAPRGKSPPKSPAGKTAR